MVTRKKKVSIEYGNQKLYIIRIIYLVVVMTESWDPIAAVEPPAVEVKLFGRWNPDDVQVGDISLQVNLILSFIYYIR